MAITLPACVKFHNARLQLCYICLQVICATVAVAQFFYFGHYGRNVQLEGSVQVLPVYTDTVAQMLKSGNPQDVCNSLNPLEEWHDATGNRYGNHTCLPICGNGSRDACVKHKETVFSESPDTLFVATQIQDHNNLGSAVQNYFVPSAEAVSVHVIIDYRCPRVSWYSSYSSPQWEWHSSSKDAHIQLIDNNEQEVRSFAPGSAIILSMSEMLHLAGVGSLDTVEPLAGLNHMPGAHAIGVAGPTRRLSGMQLNVKVDCGVGGDTRKCFLQIVAEPGTWISDSTFCNLFTGEDSHRTCRGIRIKSIFGGVLRLPDFNALFINICSSAVFFQFPQAIIFLTALYLCGQLSTVYRNVVRRDFRITTEAGAMVMRLLQHEVVFNELEAANNNGSLCGNISKAAIGDSLRHILERRHHMDTVAINQMTDFALTEVTKQFEFQEDNEGGGCSAFTAMAFDGVTGIWENIKEAFGFAKHQVGHNNLQVDVDKFAAACSSAEPMSFSNLVKLFDRDRKVPFMESFFMPSHFKLSLDEIRLQHAKAEEDAKRRESMNSKLVNMKASIEDLQNSIMAAREDLSEEHQELDETEKEVSEERREMNMMKEKINVLTLRLDQLQCKLGFEQPCALKEGVSEECIKKNNTTEKPDALTIIEQIEELAMHLEQQRRKHEFEQLQAKQEIGWLRVQMSQITEMPVCPLTSDMQAESSSTPLGSRHHLDCNLRDQVIQASGLHVDDDQSDGRQEAKDFTCKMVDGKTSTQKDSRKTDLQATGPGTSFLEPHCLEDAICELKAVPLSPHHKSTSRESRKTCFIPI